VNLTGKLKTFEALRPLAEQIKPVLRPFYHFYYFFQQLIAIFSNYLLQKINCILFVYFKYDLTKFLLRVNLHTKGKDGAGYERL
jgi:hypothetical protein